MTHSFSFLAIFLGCLYSHHRGCGFFVIGILSLVSHVNLPFHLHACMHTCHLFILALLAPHAGCFFTFLPFLQSFIFPPNILLFPPFLFVLIFLLLPFLTLPFLQPYLLLHTSSSPSHLLWLGSIGTREGVIQKNLSGLLPVRDFRLDPSLLYSLPLLALSPNLLVVWIFLSVAYFLAKLRCSWAAASRSDWLKT